MNEIETDTLTCNFCAKWVDPCVLKDCKNRNVKLPGHCPYVVDPDQWKPSTCKLYEEKMKYESPDIN
jgi:hypothetical protein